MKIVSNYETGEIVYRFFPAGEKNRKTAFCIVPPNMLEGVPEADREWQRAKAFGEVACLIDAMVNAGAKRFHPTEGQFVDNSFTPRDTGRLVERMDLKIFEVEIPHGYKAKVEEAMKGYVAMIKDKAESGARTGTELDDGNVPF